MNVSVLSFDKILIPKTAIPLKNTLDISNKTTDTELIIEFKKGNVEAFETLVYRYERKVLSLAFSYTKNEMDAKDIFQEAFIRVYKSLNKFEMRSSFSTWLYRIVANLCLTHLSSSSRKTVSISAFKDSDDDMDDSADYIEDFFKETNDDISQIDSEMLIEQAMKILSPKQRLYFTMKHIEGYKLEEIAEIHQTSVAAVKKILFVSLGKIRDSVKTLSTL